MSFGVGPGYSMVALGYPAMLTISMPIAGLPCTFGAGFAYEYDEGQNTLKMRAMASLGTGDVTLGIVYIRGYIGAEGEIIVAFPPGEFAGTIHIFGGAEGGVKVKGKKFRVIRLGLDLYGLATNAGGNIHLAGRANVYYSVDLWLVEVEGSVDWSMEYTL